MLLSFFVQYQFYLLVLMYTRCQQNSASYTLVLAIRQNMAMQYTWQQTVIRYQSSVLKRTSSLQINIAQWTLEMILVVSTCNFQLDVLQNAVSERRDNLVTRQTIRKLVTQKTMHWLWSKWCKQEGSRELDCSNCQATSTFVMKSLFRMMVLRGP